MLRRSLYKLSGALQRRIVPGLAYCQHTYESRLSDEVGRVHRWLDVGCGHALLPEWRAAAEQDLVGRVPIVVGMDLDYGAIARHRSIRYRSLCNVSRLPFEDGSFDLVTANMVVEHLDEPEVQFTEIARVLRPGGVFLFHTPNKGNYMMPFIRMVPESSKKLLARIVEGRAAEDVYPTHYRANDPSAIERAAAKSQLNVDRIEFVNSTPVFSVVPPLLLPELLLLRQLERPGLQHLRATLICRLTKRGGPQAV